MSTTLEQILALAEQLSPEEQQQVLEFMQELIAKRGAFQSELPPGGTASALLNIHFSMSAEEADAMWQAIMEAREESIYDDDEACNHGTF